MKLQLSQAAFAGLMGVSLRTVQDWEQGRRVLVRAWRHGFPSPGAQSPHEAFFYYRGAALQAVRSGDWKLHATGELYDLPKDIGETTDVAADHPDVVTRLQAYLEQARADLGDGPDRPGANTRPPGKTASPKFLIPRPGKTGAAAHEPVYKGPLKRDPNVKVPRNW